MTAPTDIEAQAIIDIFSDPAKLGNLTIGQVQTGQKLLDEWKENRAVIGGVIAGATPSQKARVQTALKERILPPGENVQNEAFQAKVSNLAGVAEGAKRAVEGVFDLAGDISVKLTATRLIPFTNLEGEQDRQKRFEQDIKNWRIERAVKHIEQFGELPPVWSRELGNVAPFLLARTPQGRTLMAVMGKGIIQGTAMTTTQFTDSEKEASRLWPAIAGGTLGAIIPGVIWALPAFKRTAARGFVRTFDEGNIEQAERVQRRVRQMEKSGDFGFSLAQASGSRAAIGLEISSAATATKNQQNKNINTLGRNLLRIARTMSNNNKNPGAIIMNIRETLEEARASIYKAAANNFKAETAVVIGKYGDEVVFDGRTYLAAVDSMILETENLLVQVGAKASRNLTRYQEKVDRLVNPVVVVEERAAALTASATQRPPTYFLLDRTNNTRLSLTSIPDKAAAEAKALQMNIDFGGLDAQAALDLRKGLNKLIGGDTVIFKNLPLFSNQNIGRKLMGDFIDNLEQPASNAAARDAVVSITDNYKQAMATSKAIEDLMITTIFGGKKFPRKLDAALKQLSKQSPQEMAATREFLETWNPQLLDDLKSTMVRDMVRLSRQPGKPGVDTPVDPSKLLNNMNGFGGPGQAGRGLFTTAESADMKLTSDAMRILQNKYFSGIIPGGIKTEDMVINAISLSPEFMGRFVARMFSSGQTLEKALLDPTFRKAIQQVAASGVGGNKTNFALLYIVRRFLVDDESADEQVTRAQLHQRAVDRGVVNPQ